MARAGVEGIRRHRAPVAVAADPERSDSFRHLGVVVDVGGAGGGKVAFLGEIRALLVRNPRHQLGEEEVDVGIALPVRVRRQVNGHLYYSVKEITSMITTKTASTILFF